MRFDFNYFSSLLLPGFIQGILYIGLLFRRSYRESRLADRLLAWILLVYVIQVASWMLGYAGWYDSHDGYSTFMFYFPFSHWYALGPLVYLYFRALTNNDFRIQGKNWLHFLPLFIWMLGPLISFLIDVVIGHWINGEAFTGHYGTHGPWARYNFGLFGNIMSSAVQFHVFIYFALTLRDYFRYRKYVTDNFSNQENIRFTWVRNLIYAMLAAQVIWLAFIIWEWITGVENAYSLDWYTYFAIGVLIYYVSISGYYVRETPTFRKLAFDKEPEPAESPEMPASAEEDLSAEMEKVSAWMEAEKPYLEEDLSLAELAAMLGFPPRKLSKIINTGLGKNFNDFVNEYRVRAVQAMLTDSRYAHLSILGMAMECGFKSKATFNRAFRKVTGKTPSEFSQSQIG